MTVLNQQYIHHMFSEQAAQFPDRVAVSFGSQAVTYGELNARANSLAHFLLAQNVKRCEPVAILLERSIEMVVSLLGVLKAGAAFVPLDPKYPHDRLAMIMSEVSPSWLITQPSLQAQLEIPQDVNVLVTSQFDETGKHSNENPELRNEPGDLNYMYYTSGSTGRPKGVMGCHKSLAHFISWEIEEFGIGAEDRVSQFAALSFDASLRDLFVPLCSGGTVCLPPQEVLQDREALVNWIETERLTLVHCVPSVFRQILAELQALKPSDRAAKFPHLRQILMAGEVLEVKHVRQWMDIFGTRIQLVNLYGSTETTMIKMFHRIEKVPPEGKSIPVGKAMKGAAALILNEKQKLCGIGQVGEIYIRSPFLSLGYYQRPELTADVFLQNPLNPNSAHPDRVYRTGDLGRYLSDGSVEYIGRRDNQVKVRGIRVELGEIEAALTQLNGIREGVVVARSEEEGDHTLIAYFTEVTDADKLTVEKLRASLQQKLPDVMIPSQFHALHEMPLLPNGKIDRKALQALAVAAKPTLGSTYVAPTTETEHLLASIWSDVLKVEKVGALDSFFALGGHSLLAMQVLARIKEATSLQVKLNELFQHLTIQDLAAHLDGLTQAGKLTRETSIPRRPKQDAYPLSNAQSRIWFQQQLDLQNSSYNMPYSVTFKGELNREALEKALNSVTARQDALRTLFLEEDGVPCQVVLEEVQVTVPYEDLSAQPRGEQETQMQKWIDHDARTAFTLSEAPLMRTKLFRISDDEHKFYINFHHIIADGTSIRLLIQEVAEFYHALLHGQDADLEALAISHVDYAVWQNEQIAAGAYQEEEAYWTEQLAKPLPVLNLPLDFDRPAVMSDEGAVLEWQLDSALSDLARQVAEREGTSLYIVMLAVYHLLLHRLSGDDDIIVGTPIATRTTRELESLLGVFINTLAIRVRFGENETFRSLLQQVKERCLEAFDRQSYPFDLLVEKVQPERDLSRPALFSVQFVFPNAPSGLHLPGLEMSEPTVHRQSSKFDMMLKVMENDQGLKVMIEYNTALLQEETVQNVAEQFQLLLASVLPNLEQGLYEPKLLTARDLEMIKEMNDTERAYSTRLAMDLFNERAEMHPERIAVRYEGQSMTYGEFHERSNRVANFLRAQGIGRNDLVALLMERSLETLVGIYGIMKAGAAYVPIDPEYPEWRIQYTLADAASRVVLTKGNCLTHLQAVRDEVPSLETILLLDESELATKADAASVELARKRIVTWQEITALASATTPNLINVPGDLAYLIYTSGSTGKPKGTMLSHRALTNMLHWWQEMQPITENDCVGQRASVCFDASVPELFWPLHHGARIVIVPTEVVVDAYRLRETMIAEKISYMKFVPTLFTSFVAGLQEMGGSQASIPSLRYVINGGEALTPKSVNLWYELFGTQAQLINQYGPTEATVDVTINKLNGPQSGTIPMGRVMPNNQCYVLDRAGNLCPVGVIGELHIGGVQLADGYLNLPEKTAESFIPNHLPNTPGDRLYRTGDLVRVRRDGMLEYVGRKDSQVKVRGFRIELGEIEEVLSQHRDVNGVGVIVHAESDGNNTLVAYFTSSKPQLDVAEIKAYLGEKVPPYMVPAFLVQLDKLPQTPNGKVDRKVLVQMATDEGFEEAKDAFVQPSTQTEERLAEIWKQLLRKDEISVRDNFFELGGHSLTLMLMHSRIRTTMDVALELKDLFANPTVAGLAAHVDSLLGAGESSAEVRIERAPKQEHYELSHAQKRLWFLYKFDPENTAYNVYFNLVLTGDIDVNVFDQALQEMVRRHSALRTVFREVDGLPRQFVQETSPFRLVYEDWTNFEAGDQEARLRAKLRETEPMPFNLGEGPLLRCFLFQTGEREYRFLLQMHHIITDAWSRDLFGKELHLIYSALVEGREPNLAPVELQYEDYAEWQAAQAEAGVFEQEQEYWLKTLAKPLPVLELPTDFPRPEVQTYSGALVTEVLPSELIERVRNLAKQEDLSMFMFLFAAYVHLLNHLTGQDDLIVGVPIAGRLNEQLSGTLGFFVNTLGIRVRTEGITTVRELVQEIKRLQVEAFQNQSVPFDLLIERLNPERDMSRPPIFSTMFQLEVGQADVRHGEHYSLELADNAFETMTSKFDMQMTLMDFEGKDCQLFLQYNTDLFKPETAQKFTTLFLQVVAGFVSDLEAPLRSLTLLTEADERVYAEMNETAVGYDNEHLLVEAFVEQAEAHPERIALSDPSVGRTMTYGELHERSNQLAHYLRSQGVQRNQLVAIMMERSVEMVVGLYGILKSGAAYVPIDPEYPAQRIQYMLQDSGAHILLTKEMYLDQVEATEALQAVILLEESLSEAPHLDAENVLSVVWNDLANQPKTLPASIGTADDLAYMIYTSGSTGQPKGVLIQHRAILNRLNWHQDTFRATPNDVIIQRTTVCFDDSVIELFWPLRHGATLSIMPQDIVLDPKRLMRQLVQERATYMQFVPSLLAVVVSALQEMAPIERPLLRSIIVSGEALPSKLVEQWFTLYPTGTKLANLYGPTEAAVDVSGAVYEGSQSLITIGKPLANTHLYVLNAHGVLCPINVKGELYVGGVQLALGYHNKPEKTAESFVPNHLPNSIGERLYRTGDAVRLLSDGTIEFLGRVDNQVKIRGFRIELGEIEEALTQYPALELAAVIARTGPDGNKALFGYYTADGDLDASAIKDHLRTKLPDYMVPPRLVQLAVMPLTPNGKVDRKALEYIASQDAFETVSEYTAPTTATEEILAGIWSDLLKREQVGVHDNFFDLGGHSLLAIQTLNRIQSELNAGLALKDLFTYPTIAELSPYIDDLLSSGTTHTRLEIPKAPIQEQYALSNAQKRLWFTYKLDPNSRAYNVPLEILIKRDLNVKLFEKATLQLIARHDALRTVFVEVGGEPRQKVLPTSPVRLFYKDLTSFSEEEQLHYIRETIALSESKPFDLKRGPLVRVMLFKREEGLYHFYLNLHHIITDGWSNELIAREHGVLYEALLAGEEPQLAELPLQYTDYAEWQEQELSTDRGRGDESYWLTALAKPLPMLELPTDFPRPDVRTDHGDAIWMTLPRELTAALRTRSADGEYSLFMLLLAGYVLFLNQETKQRDLIVGTPIAGRLNESLESVVGFFVNTLAIRTRLDGVELVQDLMQVVKEQFLTAYEHQAYPFDLLIEKLNPERDLSRTPIFSTVFTYRQFLEAMSPMYEPLVPDTHEISKFDLTINVSDAGDDLRLRFEYNTDLFKQETVRHFAEGVEKALHAIASHPTAPLDDAFRRVEESNQERDTVQTRFERQAALTPQNVALTCEGTSWTYERLNAEANRIAHKLRQQGVGAGTPVVLVLDRTPQMIASILGVVKAGGVYIPVDPDYPEERITYIVENSEANHLLTTSAAPELLQAFQGVTLLLDRDADELATMQETNPDSVIESDSLIYAIYTSGSTGKPKGVLLTHHNVLRLMDVTQPDYNFGGDDVWTMFHSYCFDFSVWELYGALLYGGRVVIVPKVIAQSTSDFYDLLVRERVTVLNQTPSAFYRLIEADEKSASGLLGRLRYVIFGGEALNFTHLRPFLERYPNGPQLVNMYGITETTVHATYRPISRVDVDTVWKGSPIGLPLGDLTFYLLDENREEVADGEPGEIYIAGPGLAARYLNNPEKTAEVFVERDGQRVYKTGDIARRHENGELEYLGRVDHQVKIRGFRIELGEIENTLARHELVKNVLVVASPDANGDLQIVAYLETDADLPAKEWRRFVRQSLPEYMIPARVISVQEFPVTPNGKIDRKALHEIGEQQAEVQRARAAVRAAEHEKPASSSLSSLPIQQDIQAIWRDVLQHDDFGVDDNFFDVGGHSFALAKVHSLLNEKLSLDLPLTDLFKYPTIQSLAEALAPSSDESEGQAFFQDVPANASREEEAVAIIGIALRFPEASSPYEFWQNLKNGRESVREFPMEEIADTPFNQDPETRAQLVRAAGLLDDIDMFDASFFGIPEKEARLMHPQHRLFLECSWEAIEDAGYNVERINGKVSVYGGCGGSEYLPRTGLPNLSRSEVFQGMIASQPRFLTTRVSYKLNLKGESMFVDTACSTSLVAIHMACESLLNRKSDYALAGGATIVLPQKRGYMYEPGFVHSEDGHCRAFDKSSTGTADGSGAGVVFLKRLSDAVRDGDPIYAVIRGSALNNDGSLKIGYTAPSQSGQAEVIAAAHAAAGVTPDDITYIEAHGTGTVLGDPIEVAALTEVFRRRTDRRNYCALGSIKTNIGHLDTAAGVAGLIKTALALHHRELPPSLNFQEANPACKLEESPFYVITEHKPWDAENGVRRAGVSAFGIGGTNAHVILEEAPSDEQEAIEVRRGLL
ncbi:amino acid adenylation domain-containing protein [Tumebacillus sp. ITR2]|uniref:Amino acid adenylation domain-containing protein n=1 Tax=Tumebacillus amylolyticus TaxID=2801339 RepID=A0ABS1JA85_9BACL|nr:non-ribosomal peptide synthetase [Tumebacillus amylolyticus]MBL0387095.1 amino acid adenylation domain-containing protein [Tumebacillus amylolyticus]